MEAGTLQAIVGIVISLGLLSTSIAAFMLACFVSGLHERVKYLESVVWSLREVSFNTTDALVKIADGIIKEEGTEK